MLPQAKNWDEIYRRFQWNIPKNYNLGSDVCDKWALKQPDRLALIQKYSDGKSENITYGDLKRQSDRLSNGFLDLGIQKGDRVGLLLPQRPECVVAHIAIYKIGAIALPLASVFGVEALSHRLSDAGAKCIITDAEGLKKIEQISSELQDLEKIVCVDGQAGTVDDFKRIIHDSKSEFTPINTTSEDPAIMVYTSGTTGLPKGALHAHRVILGHGPGIELSHDFFPQENDLMWTPADWAWAGGLFNILLSGLRNGVPVLGYNFRKFDPEIAVELMVEFQVKNSFIPPTALKIMKSVKGIKQHNNLSLRTIMSGGEAVGREVYEWSQEEFGITINEIYGQTECNYVLGSCQALGVSRPGLIGKQFPGHRVGIVDNEGQELAPNQLGQIAVKRPDPVMFLGYWGNPQATTDKFVGDWMLTGDQGVMDQEGYFAFVGRDDDVITSAGFRIGPGEIEDCLIGHPAVAIAAVVGKPDPLRTEIVKAYIQLTNTAAGDAHLAENIQNYVRTKLSAHEYPREIEFVDEMPLTTTGKVIRRHFRELSVQEAKAEREAAKT